MCIPRSTFGSPLADPFVRSRWRGKLGNWKMCTPPSDSTPPSNTAQVTVGGVHIFFDVLAAFAAHAQNPDVTAIHERYGNPPTVAVLGRPGVAGAMCRSGDTCCSTRRVVRCS